VIFLDNGRTNLLGTEFQEALYCIRCGACLNVCPVYRNIGGHAYGSVYPGPIGSVISPLLTGFESWGDLPQASSLCGACTEVCPVGIHLHDHLINLRSKMVDQGKEPLGMKIALGVWMAAWKRPWAYKLLSKVGYWALRPFMQKKADGREVAESLPSVAAGWTMSRTFPAVAKRTFHDRWADLERGESR